VFLQLRSTLLQVIPADLVAHTHTHTHTQYTLLQVIPADSASSATRHSKHGKGGVLESVKINRTRFGNGVAVVALVALLGFVYAAKSAQIRT